MNESSELPALLQGIAECLLQSAEPSRTDRLWPAHYEVFETNALCVAFGATGTATLLARLGREIPRAISDWIVNRPMDTSLYPPGLLRGTAGIAYALSELGLPDRAEDAMRTCYESPLLYTDPSMFHGVAGWGLASLYFFRRTKQDAYLVAATKAAEWLCTTAVIEGRTAHWRHWDGRVHYGYGYGASGIALFLVSLGDVTGDRRLAQTAAAALRFDLGRAIEGEFGVGWTDVENGMKNLPYWEHGAAGIGTVAVRASRIVGDLDLAAMAERIASSLELTWAANPSQLNGMSGIGEFMLDMYIATGNQRYRQNASRLASAIALYTLKRPSGLVLPGRWLSRICFDFGTGSAGVGVFLHRLLTNRPDRFLVDL